MVLPLVFGIVYSVFRMLKVDPWSEQELSYGHPLLPLDNEGLTCGEYGEFSQQERLWYVASWSQPQC